MRMIRLGFTPTTSRQIASASSSSRNTLTTRFFGESPNTPVLSSQAH